MSTTADHPVPDSRIVHITRKTRGPVDTHKIKPIKYQVIACWKLESENFDFDSWFITHYAAGKFGEFSEFYKKKTEMFKEKDPDHYYPRISIFGHTDPIGKVKYNKELSEKRSKAVYSVLTRDYDMWKSMYTSREQIKFLQNSIWDNGFFIRNKLLELNIRMKPGIYCDDTAKAVKLYMDYLCKDFIMDKKEMFLGDGSCAFQGCSEFNPLEIMSKDEYQRLNEQKDYITMHSKNTINRRVIVFMFKPKLKVEKKNWPCSKAPEINGCIGRFWSKNSGVEGDKRRKISNEHKKFEDTQDTFACNFYQRMAELSPCEKIIPGQITYRMSGDFEIKIIKQLADKENSKGGKFVDLDRRIKVIFDKYQDKLVNEDNLSDAEKQRMYDELNQAAIYVQDLPKISVSHKYKNEMLTIKVSETHYHGDELYSVTHRVTGFDKNTDVAADVVDKFWSDLKGNYNNIKINASNELLKRRMMRGLSR